MQSNESLENFSCLVCSFQTVKSKFSILCAGVTRHLCSNECVQTFRSCPTDYIENRSQNKRFRPDLDNLVTVFCSQCSLSLSPYGNYPTMNSSEGQFVFCTQDCLSIFKIANRRTAKCNFCGNRKSSQIMVKGGRDSFFCTSNCLQSFNSNKSGSRRRGRVGRPPGSRSRGNRSPTRTIRLGEREHQKNKYVQYEIPVASRGVNYNMPGIDAEVQTELDFDSLETILVPIPIPYHQTIPMGLYTQNIPQPLLIPIPIPIPVPFTSVKNDFKKVYTRPLKVTPTDPFSIPPIPINITHPVKKTSLVSGPHVPKKSYGVDAWTSWQKSRHAKLSSSGEALPDLLYSTALQMNDGLCEFVQEVRKPTGEQYAPDSLYYLCLEIQQYIHQSGRTDNIFCDLEEFGTFTDLLDSILRSWDVRLNENFSGQLVCRIQEEYLWETKQLGIHSPQVVLNTILYFNTKYFFLSSVDEHLALSFSNIIKQSRRVLPPSSFKENSGSGGGHPTRQLCLCYYPKHTAGTEGGSCMFRGDEVLEQPENIHDVSRCPLRIYDFYLSKCPPGVRSRTDVFYLKPEIGANVESSQWYTTEQMNLKDMDKMLRRILLVKEIQQKILARHRRAN